MTGIGGFLGRTSRQATRAPHTMMRTLLGSDDRGQMLMLFAGGLAIFLGLVGLALDVGQLVQTRTDLQKTSDAAVLAAIQEIAGTVQDQESATSVAREYVYRNNGAGEIHTAVSFESSDGITVDTVTVETKKHVSYLFLRLLGMSGATVGATATAQVQIVTGYSFDDTSIFPYAVWGGNDDYEDCDGMASVYGICEGVRRVFRSTLHYEDQVTPDPGSNSNWNMGSANFKGYFNGGDRIFEGDTTLTYSYGGLADGRQPEEALERHYLNTLDGNDSYIVLPVIESIDCQGGNNCQNPNTQIQFRIVAWTCLRITEFSLNSASTDWAGEIATEGCVIAGGTIGGPPPDDGEPVIKTVVLIS